MRGLPCRTAEIAASFPTTPIVAVVALAAVAGPALADEGLAECPPTASGLRLSVLSGCLTDAAVGVPAGAAALADGCAVAGRVGLPLARCGLALPAPFGVASTAMAGAGADAGRVRFTDDDRGALISSGRVCEAGVPAAAVEVECRLGVPTSGGVPTAAAGVRAGGER